jgi:5-methylcytosine-specific restriction endonuclease McrA
VRIPKRRQAIFEKSDGRCHYCSTVLTLDGKWHVEHMMPRALNGSDEIGNLVAACVTCNLAKRDRTALEFVASLIATRRTNDRLKGT